MHASRVGEQLKTFSPVCAESCASFRFLRMERTMKYLLTALAFPREKKSQLYNILWQTTGTKTKWREKYGSRLLKLFVVDPKHDKRSRSHMKKFVTHQFINQVESMNQLRSIWEARYCLDAQRKIKGSFQNHWWLEESHVAYFSTSNEATLFRHVNQSTIIKKSQKSWKVLTTVVVKHVR